MADTEYKVNSVSEEASDEQVAQGAANSETAAAAAKPGFGAKVKEWCRKQIVTLKRKPQRISFIFFVIVSCCWLIWLFTFSKTASKNSGIPYAGLCIFVNTLLSILILALFLNAFPKYKKPNIIMIVLVFVFIVIMIVMDSVYYSQVSSFVSAEIEKDATSMDSKPYVYTSLSYSIAHIVLLGISAVLLATLPLYKKLILKINTNKQIEDNEIKEKIDVEDE